MLAGATDFLLHLARGKLPRTVGSNLLRLDAHRCRLECIGYNRTCVLQCSVSLLWCALLQLRKSESNLLRSHPRYRSRATSLLEVGSNFMSTQRTPFIVFFV